ncbi:MAG: TatD family hydrolase [Prevotellaceae bacterium]|jgi:TatD DNase family protein|nr:TatD family hydrolase [Prevotellaceae bacterium]
MTLPVDIHTHRLPDTPGTAIVNRSPQSFAPQAGHYYSVGIHPWHASEQALTAHDIDLFSHPQVLAIGEAGADKLAQAPLTQQLPLFEQQARVAEHLHKPLIIHSVKATEPVLALKQALRPDSPWIIHGFRGKPQLAARYLHHGCYLSYGEHYPPESLLATPLNRLLLETDESRCPISQLYEQAAAVLGMPVGQLYGAVAETVRALFFQAKRL